MVNISKPGMDVWDVLDPRHANKGYVFDWFSRCAATLDAKDNLRIWREIDDLFYIGSKYEVKWNGESQSVIPVLLQQQLDQYIVQVIKDDQ